MLFINIFVPGLHVIRPLNKSNAHIVTFHRNTNTVTAAPLYILKQKNINLLPLDGSRGF
jgi:hypothetical protein